MKLFSSPQDLVIGSLSVLLGLLVLVSPAFSVDFDSDVFPILESNCFDCHDGETLKGGIGLDSYYHAHQPTDAGEPLFVAGEPEKSVLLHVVTETDPEKRMPPNGDPLSANEIETLRAWIEDGAEWPDDGWRPPVHWSFVPPTRPDLPEAGDAMLESRNPNAIDRFIASKLVEHDLHLNPETEPARLLRRVHLDLTGLPPTPEQVDTFLENPDFEHYRRVVDELLASPAYGEKWAIPWLDLARYADSEGYQRDEPRPMWPWRDWVIRALNDDMPFDRFSIEQLAGDLLPDPSESQLVATGFHQNAPLNLEAGTDPMEDHYKRNVDRTNTTGTIWLGLTVGCAQCHNHKYDPISAKEYYELYAFFNNGPMESRQEGEKMGMSNLRHIGPKVEVARGDYDAKDEGKARAHYEAVVGEIREDLLAGVERVVKEKPEGHASLPKEVRDILDSGGRMNLEQCEKVSRRIMPGDDAMKRRIDEAEILEDRIAAQKKKEVRVMGELEEMRPTFIAKRGDFLTHGARVSPGVPSSLHEFSEELPRNRLGLAKWLVSPENPLVARTFVNRLWIEIFGQGLVTTPEDFGSQGEMPSHPDLLDWLAVAFVKDDDWSMKAATRRIVLSATYRQSTAVDESFATADPRNQLLWRHPGHRFRAEVIRDQALAISGLLSDRMFGVHVRPYQPPTFWRKTAGRSETYYVPSQGEDAHRRGVYTLWRRNSHYPSFANFDAPDRTSCVVQRDLSNTPLQALTLLNDPAYVEMAEAFGERIAVEGGGRVDDQIRWAFRVALAREPRETETSTLRSAYDAALADTGSPAEARTEVATILLNLHETITRS